MKLILPAIILTLIIPLLSIGQTDKEKRNLNAYINDAYKKGDDLALRILSKKYSRANMTYAEWMFIRKIFHRKPGVGADLLFKWDSARPELPAKFNEAFENNVKEKIEQADNEMLGGNFENAFTTYQKIAQLIKGEVRGGNNENWYLYQGLLHSMGRALYGAGRFEEALTVYNWISPKYPRYRQILFEKMWSAFMCGRIDQAYGAIVSQRSEYFSNFLEPESYLLEIYIYKKLCRDKEIKRVISEIDEYQEKLKQDNERSFFSEWAKKDIEFYSLWKLITVEPKYKATLGVTETERKNEKANILSILKKRFESEKNSTLKVLEKVKAYSRLATAADSLKLQKFKLPSRDDLMASGKELWLVEDTEEWVDEIGGHVYSGESQCPNK